MRSNEPICSFQAMRANDAQAAKKSPVTRTGYFPITDKWECRPREGTPYNVNPQTGRFEKAGEK